MSISRLVPLEEQESLTIEQKLLRRQYGPEQVFQGLAPVAVRQESLEFLQLRRARLPAQSQRIQPANRLFITHLLMQPAFNARVLGSNLVIECLPIIDMQSLPDAGV